MALDGRDIFALKRLNGEADKAFRTNRRQTVDCVHGVVPCPFQESTEHPVHGCGSLWGNHSHFSGKAREAVEDPALLPQGDLQAHFPAIPHTGLEGIEVLANLLELVGLSGGEPLDEALEDRGSKASVIGGKPCQLVIQPEQDAPRQLTGAGGQHLSGDHQACSASDLDIVVASFFPNEVIFVAERITLDNSLRRLASSLVTLE